MNGTDPWRTTSRNEPRGYVQPQRLEDLWFHTGTNCNLRCPIFFEGAKPGDDRIEFVHMEDARRFIDEALDLGVKQFSFTGGEPFVNPEIVAILETALRHRPCLVLTNATAPLMDRMTDVLRLLEQPNALKFRVSLDYPDPVRHDESRGKGDFKKALDTLGRLHRAGFGVSIARRMLLGEDCTAVDRSYTPLFRSVGVVGNIPILKFPEFHPPGASPEVPEITETCMNLFMSAAQRAALMGNFSKMVVRKKGRCGVYACTLVDDVKSYDLGPTLQDAMRERVMLGHHRCCSRFSRGASCSELE